jgi:hypothetical protein
MAENELNDNDFVEQPRAFHLEWLLPIFTHPRRTFEKITRQTRGVWILPLLILSLLAVVYTLVQGGPRQLSAQMGASLPQDYQYYSQEMQDQVQQAYATQQGALSIYVFPALGALASIWLGWFILGSAMHLVLTLAGSRNSNTAALNVIGWAAMPLLFRYLVRIIYTMSTQSLITAPGISGFIPTGSGGVLGFIAVMLRQVDFYILWGFVLMLIGAFRMAGLSRGKTWAVILGTALIFLIIAALPGFAGLQFKSLLSI